jgi:membrane protease subunit (stomatin/prohibitin family)
MGLFRFLKDEVVEIIDWVEDGSDTLIHRFEGRSKAIKYGAQLTVRESQVAIFVNEGRIADVFAPGRYPLTTENMPVLTRLNGWMHGFQSPFLCDVFFVTTRQFPGLKWGTPSPVIMRDPDLNQVRVRAFGSYTLRVADAARFFREIAGTQGGVRVQDIEEKLRHAIISRFCDGLAELGVSVLDLARSYNELGGRMRPLLQPDFDAFGLELVQFYIENASVPPEVEALLDKVTQIHAVGDINRYAKFEAASSIRTLAEKSGGGGLVGVGAQVALGAMVGQQLAEAAQVPPPVTPAAAPVQAPASLPPSGAPAAPAPDRQQIIALLKELGALKEAGVLTDEEFRAKKAELLAKL